MANKKINQLVAKTTIQSTDLFPIGDATTGTLFKKTIADLQAAIGGAVISVNGLVGTVVLDTDDILEPLSPTNKYFTDARARAAISLTTTGSSGASTYSSSTGVLNVPTYTLAGLGGITASFLSGGLGISYNSSTGVISYSGTVYTDSSVRGLFSAGTGISYNSTTGVITNSAIYTDALARAAISGTAPITYNSTTGAIGITQASGSTNGYLSSTDWTTFNSKQGALSGGTAGYVTFWTNSSTLGADSSFFWDNSGKKLGIGTATPRASIETLGYVYSGGNWIPNDTSGAAYYIGDLATGSSFTYISGKGTSSTDTYLAFSTNNLERMRINASGNVGIGTSSPTTMGSYQILEVTNSTGGILRLTTSTTSGGYIAGNTGGLTYDTIGALPHIFYTNGTSRMTITSNGLVGIGVSSPAKYFDVYSSYSVNTTAQVKLSGSQSVSGKALYMGSFSNTAYITQGGTFTNGWLGDVSTTCISGIFMDSTSTESNIQFATTTTNNAGPNERMRVTGSGNILMGTTTDNGERLYVSGNIRATGTITANSDINLKKNLLKIENALEKVEQINGYTYEFKEDDSKRHAGVIAQEIEGVLPEIVNKGNDGLLGVEYGNISALLIEAIKEQQTQINELKALLNK